MSLFTSDPAIGEVGELYLLCQAAVFPLTGAGLACYFTCLGVGVVIQPFALAALRLALIVAGAWSALAPAGSAFLAFGAVAVGIASFALGLLVVFNRPPILRLHFGNGNRNGKTAFTGATGRTSVRPNPEG